MLRYSTVIAALILAGGVVTASAASKTTHHHAHRYHGLYMQTPSSDQMRPYGDRYDRAPQYGTQDDYMTDHAKGSVKDD